MTPTFEKRVSDVAISRFLPGDDGCLTSPLPACASHAISADDLATFANAAKNMDSNLEGLLLAGFASLLSRLTRQDAIPIAVEGSDFAFFQVDADCSFREVVNQSSSPAREPVRQTRDLGSESNGEFCFLSRNKPASVAEGCRLCLHAGVGELQFTNPTGQWGESQLRSWLEYLLALLNAACRNPEMPVTQLPLWSDTSARDFYTSLNQTTADFPGEDSVVTRVRSVSRRRPEATAIVSEDQRLTYKELDEESSRLASHLASMGAGPNKAVAICMERTVYLPLAILAVLKSGAYYVPLDSQSPAQRLQAILEECAPVALVSDTAMMARFQDAFDPRALATICMDKPWPDLNSSPAAIEPSGPQELAYTIYTSGTTGKPKGVAIRQNALLNLLCSMSTQPGMDESDRTLAVAPISFDIATMDMLLPMFTGGTLVLARRRDSVDPYRLAELIEEHQITFMQATPVTWRMLVNSGWKGKQGLKMVSGGEALARELANNLCRLGGELWNCYGPTETTIYSGVIRIHPEAGIVPVGPPIANTTFYVMDRSGFPVPPGVPGELYIGGVGVSPGYVNRPQLTEERFVPDRWSSDDNPLERSRNNGHVRTEKKLFRTGDLVRVVRGSELEFFGRLDHQVKLRGFRIELGEVESVLRTHPSIRDAVVVLREDLPGEPRLVAYVISPGPPAGGAELREFAAKSLPQYMIPAVIVALDEYPLSPSGKIDRRALPVPESIPGKMVADIPEAAAAADDLEAKLLRIFRDVLRNNLIGVTDNFFRYGGYSLLTMRLFSRIDKEMHVRLPISLLFDAPTVRDLARVIRRGISPSVIVPIRPYGRSAPIFIIQSYLLYSAMLEIVENDRPVYGVREMGDEHEPQSVEERARKFAREILAVSPSGPLYLAGWCAAGTLTVEIARQLREEGHEVGLVALFDAERPGFMPSGGVRFGLSRLQKKLAFHLGRLHRIPWGQKVTYILEAIERNWDWAVESYYTNHFRSMLWLHDRFGLALSETAFNNVYASLAALRDFSILPYPGKLNLFRASDVPDLSEVDTTLGWSSIAEGGVEVNFVPGDHVSMFKKPNVESLARRLQQEIQKAELSFSRT